MDTLNKLRSVNIDASKGYAYAAENIRNENFRNFLEAYAVRRQKYAKQMEDEIKKVGDDPIDGSSLLGDLHLALTKLRQSVSESKDTALLEECVRGETESISAYEKAIQDKSINPGARDVAIHHLNKIRAAHGTMRELARVV